jgi:hypothetical protein
MNFSGLPILDIVPASAIPYDPMLAYPVRPHEPCALPRPSSTIGKPVT